eukprot:1068172-Prymnesium_polylepis.2
MSRWPATRPMPSTCDQQRACSLAWKRPVGGRERCRSSCPMCPASASQRASFASRRSLCDALSSLSAATSSSSVVWVGSKHWPVVMTAINAFLVPLEPRLVFSGRSAGASLLHWLRWSSIVFFRRLPSLRFRISMRAPHPWMHGKTAYSSSASAPSPRWPEARLCRLAGRSTMPSCVQPGCAIWRGCIAADVCPVHTVHHQTRAR